MPELSGGPYRNGVVAERPREVLRDDPPRAAAQGDQLPFAIADCRLPIAD